ncbi:MAG: PAS domain S-box protein [Ignavibacteria bacterium]|nr:PAS domain S-box protein [Ignavibacteria bacterium]
MRILLVEDNDYDVKLFTELLKNSFPHSEIKRVMIENDFVDTLNNYNPDVIITDYILPNFDGMKVLKLTQELNPFIPVIILTGSINEEIAVECMKAGATDYVLKEYHQKLPYSIREALEKAKAIREKIIAEEKLIENELLFRTITEASMVGVFLIKENKFTYVNEGFTNIFGYSREELINKLSLIDLIPLELKSTTEQKLNSLINGSINTLSFVTKAINKFNQEIYVEIFTKRVALKNENYIMGAVINVTDTILYQMEVQKSELLFRTIWENSIDAMRLIDENGLVIRVNKAYCDLFEKSENELLGKPFFIVYDESSYEHNIDRFKERLQKGLIKDKIETQMTLWNKRKIYLEARNKILKIDNKTYILTIFRDVTQRIQYELELIKAKEEALEMSRLKSNFLANMSHEIRTPLNGMIGFSELLKEHLTGEHKEWAEIIYNGSIRLLDTLNTILDFTQIEADKVVPYFQEFDAREVTCDIVKLYEKIAERKKIKLQFECEDDKIPFVCDEKLYRRIVSNLVNNAVKFTLKGSVCVKLLYENGFLRLDVKDTGIGIPADKLDYIFEEFRQVSEGLGRQFEGTGLGLTIVKKYVEKLNGKISVSSEVGVGSTFSVTLPINPFSSKS